MVDFILSAAAGQIYELLKEQILCRVNLVRGAEEQVSSLAAELMTIGAVLDDAENRRFKDKTVNLWLSRLEQTASQMVGVLDEWNYAILKLKLQQSDDDDVVHPPTKKGKFRGGSGGNKLGLLNKLNSLGGEVDLWINLDDDALEEGGIVEDAWEAELRSKNHLNKLLIRFNDEISNGSSSEDSVRMGVVDALHPHPNLQELDIRYYKGSKLPIGWMASPVNRLKKVVLYDFPKLTSLPTLGRLPCLEYLNIEGMEALERVGREFTGIEGENEDIGVSNSNTYSNLPPLAFPKLKELTFSKCPKWKEWEDIRVEEEYDEPTFSCMPSLTLLKIWECYALKSLPHHLLHKESSLQTIIIIEPPELKERYTEKEDPHWKSILLGYPM